MFGATSLMIVEFCWVNCFPKACFKRRILHASNSIVSIMFMLSATSETIKFDVSNCGRPKL